MTGLEARNLTMRFGDFTAVRDVSFSVDAGEFVTLLGPSGCGKTTLLKVISGFLRPSSGRLNMGRVDVTGVPPERRDTALCFQSYALFPHLTVRGNLEFGLRQKRVACRDLDERVARVAETLDLGLQMDKLPNQLSGGQQQRVSLGRALAMRPGVILFDEPLSNLDARLRDQVRVEIRRITREFGLTAIYVTHDQSEALAMSDRIFVMNAGRVEQADAPEDLYDRPRTAFVADFIGAANILTGRVLGQAPSGGWRVETALGEMISGPGKGLGGTCLGDKVALCWRPEAAVANNMVGHCNTLKGRVLSRAFQGHFTEIWAEAAGVKYRLTPGRSDVREGDDITVHLPPEALLVLESDE